MKNQILWKALLLNFASLLFLLKINAQSPGMIVQPRNPSATFLNPDGNKYTSKTPAGFTNDDLGQSEIPYKVVPPATPEPVGDQLYGPTGGSTDFVANSRGEGFYTYYDGTNVMFRFRVGSLPKGGKSFSVLIDTDLRIGLSGFYADPNYVAPTSSRSGNPGFELEVVYDLGKNVSLYNVDGTLTGTLIASYPESTNALMSIALTRNSGDADYFVDFGIPASALGSAQYIRIAGTTGTNSGSALSNNASDLFGINDLATKKLIQSWEDVISNQCGFPVSAISLNGTGICTCTPRPTMNSPISVGSNVAVSGTWNRLDPSKSSQAVITIFQNGVSIGNTIATTGIPWTFTVPTIYSGDQFYAKAQAAPEFMCLQSDPVFASCSTSIPASPQISCASTKGLEGTIPLNSTVQIYSITGPNASPTYSPIPGPFFYTNNGTNITFDYSGATQTASPCSNGNANLNVGTYYIITNTNGCLSTPTSICIYGSVQNNWNGIAANGISLSTPVYNTDKSISGTGAAAGDLLRLYINNIYIQAITTTSTSFTFNNVSLQIGDVIRIAEQSTAPGSCLTTSGPTTVQCFTFPPTIWTNADGKLVSTATSISGACNSVGATITLYKGAQPGGAVVTTTTTDVDGYWTINGLTLIGGETYYALANAGCASAYSNQVDINDPEPVCAYISGSYTESSNTVTGTFASPFTGTVRLYLDSIVIKTITVTNKTTWTINVNNITQNLYPGGKLSVTTQSVGWAEKICAAPITIACDMPSAPVPTPTSVTIYQGQTAAFSINNSDSRFLYSLQDASDSTYATSTFGNDGSQNIVSNVFNKPGTYNLQLTAKNLSGATCSATTNVVVTVNNIILPIKFLSFTVKRVSDNERQLKWTVVNGSDISHFEVERSNDCVHFGPVATISNQSATDDLKDFSFIDHTILVSKNVCYRIKAVNIDGNVLYSKIVTISEDNQLKLQLAPNPASTETTIYAYSDRDQSIIIELLDMSGRIVYNKQIQANEGRNGITISGLNKLAKGQYIVKVITTSEISQLKLQVQ